LASPSSARLRFCRWYAQGVLGYSAQDSGLVRAPMMLGFVIGSLIGGQLTTRTGRYKIQTVIGMVIAVAGMFLCRSCRRLQPLPRP